MTPLDTIRSDRKIFATALLPTILLPLSSDRKANVWPAELTQVDPGVRSVEYARVPFRILPDFSDLYWAMRVTYVVLEHGRGGDLI